MMGFNLAFGSLAIIAVTMLLQCAEGYHVLAGEDTPVWTAHCSHDKCNKKDKLVTYMKLEKGALKRAIEYMKSDTFKSLTYLQNRHARSVEHFDESQLESLPSSGNRSKRAGAYQYGIIQAYVLLVLDYDTSGVTDDASREKYINEKILYALAYWQSFNSKVAGNQRRKNWSKVGVNLAGIIVNLNRAAAPYLEASLLPQEALRESNSYWSPPPHLDFAPRDGYHAVATMTDTRRSASTNGYFESVVLDDRASSGTIIVWDNLPFRSVRYLASIVPFQQCVNTLYNWARRGSQIPEHMKPGKVVEIVLPGKLMTPEQQCVGHGYTNFERICPEYSVGCEIFCEEKHWYNIFKNSCRSIGKALEGTPCVSGQVFGTNVADKGN